MEIDGIRFASKAEGHRYCTLKILERAGAISELTLQPQFVLQVGNTPLGSYRADFQYRDRANDQVVVEDVKGVRTPLYKWKKKHFEAQYGMEIHEVPR